MPDEYYSCEWVEGGLAFNRRSLHTCLIVHEGGGLPFIADYNGDALRLDSILSARRRIREENQNGGHAACRGCAHLQRKAWPRLSYMFHIVGIAHFSYCNIECNYCFLQVQDPESFKSGFNPYSALPAIRHLIDRGLLAPGATIDWGGGEPTVYHEFDDLFVLLGRHGCHHYIHTNGTYIPKSIRNGLAGNSVDIVCSVDAGFVETYRNMKRRDLLRRVWRNLQEFKRIGCRVTVKYIVKEENCSPEEVGAFLNSLQDLGASMFLVDVDYYQKWQSDVVVDGIVRLRCIGFLRGLHTDFGFTGAKFHPFTDLERRVALGIRRFCMETLQQSLDSGAVADRKLDELLRLYAMQLVDAVSEDPIVDLLIKLQELRAREAAQKQEWINRLAQDQICLLGKVLSVNPAGFAAANIHKQRAFLHHSAHVPTRNVMLSDHAARPAAREFNALVKTVEFQMLELEEKQDLIREIIATTNKFSKLLAYPNGIRSRLSWLVSNGRYIGRKVLFSLLTELFKHSRPGTPDSGN